MSLTAIVIENDMHFCNSVAEVLCDMNFETTTCYQYNNAIENIDKKFFNLAVIDLSILTDHTFEYRHGGGYDICKRLEALDTGTLKIVVSSNPYPELAAELSEMGCKYFDKKTGHFRSKLRDYLSRKDLNFKINYPDDYEIFFTGINSGIERDIMLHSAMQSSGVGISGGSDGVYAIINRIIKDNYPYVYKKGSTGFIIQDKSLYADIWSMKRGKAIRIGIDKGADRENTFESYQLKSVFVKYYDSASGRDEYEKCISENLAGK